MSFEEALKRSLVFVLSPEVFAAACNMISVEPDIARLVGVALTLLFPVVEPKIISYGVPLFSLSFSLITCRVSSFSFVKETPVPKMIFLPVGMFTFSVGVKSIPFADRITIDSVPSSNIPPALTEAVM